MEDPGLELRTVFELGTHDRYPIMLGFKKKLDL